VGAWAKSVSGEHTIIAVTHTSAAKAIAVRGVLRPHEANEWLAAFKRRDPPSSSGEDCWPNFLGSSIRTSYLKNTSLKLEP
jgi:hypothetical protein